MFTTLLLRLPLATNRRAGAVGNTCRSLDEDTSGDARRSRPTPLPKLSACDCAGGGAGNAGPATRSCDERIERPSDETDETLLSRPCCCGAGGGGKI